MGGEGPHHRWSVMRPVLRLGQNLSGFLNWALEGLGRLQENGRFTKSMEADELQELYESMSDPITAFIEEHIVMESSGVASKDAVYQTYRQFCKAKGYTNVTKHTFTIEIKARLAGVLETKRKIRGKQQRCWQGMRLRMRGTQGTLGTHPYPKETPEDRERDIEPVPSVPCVPHEDSQNTIQAKIAEGDPYPDISNVTHLTKKLEELAENVFTYQEKESVGTWISDEEAQKRLGWTDEDLKFVLERALKRSRDGRDPGIYRPRPGYLGYRW